uniref:Uncharacterized protein n=1 Tax=Anguilla anguilla TaxID=7936 RepID=A0A0E9X6F9_ANGAN
MTSTSTLLFTHNHLKLLPQTVQQELFVLLSTPTLPPGIKIPIQKQFHQQKKIYNTKTRHKSFQ